METRGEIEEELTNYIKGIMTEDGIDRNQDIGHIIALIPRTVTREDSEILNKPISMEEVENVVSQMAQGKAPIMDGFTTNLVHFF